MELVQLATSPFFWIMVLFILAAAILVVFAIAKGGKIDTGFSVPLMRFFLKAETEAEGKREGSSQRPDDVREEETIAPSQPQVDEHPSHVGVFIGSSAKVRDMLIDKAAGRDIIEGGEEGSADISDK